MASFGCAMCVTEVMVVFEEALLLSGCGPGRSRTKPVMVLRPKLGSDRVQRLFCCSASMELSCVRNVFILVGFMYM